MVSFYELCFWVHINIFKKDNYIFSKERKTIKGQMSLFPMTTFYLSFNEFPIFGVCSFFLTDVMQWDLYFQYSHLSIQVSHTILVDVFAIAKWKSYFVWLSWRAWKIVLKKRKARRKMKRPGPCNRCFMYIYFTFFMHFTLIVESQFCFKGKGWKEELW